ncbi:hypothetical protein G5I_00808 [Acromyrmex echinatior]|uniref:Uncharacterized protein n=1 Tax=Acromyrmex echinatior TaxID=103372 RepID=F4W5V8_ACREC|nr:hypothetical protein G5I_00808 [Acromyrmex echinatior]
MDGVQKFPYRKFFNGTKRPDLHNSSCTTTSTADNRSKPTHNRDTNSVRAERKFTKSEERTGLGSRRGLP